MVETSKLPHFLENQLTDGDEIVSLTRQLAALYPQEDFWCSLLLEAESTPGQLEGLGQLRNPVNSLGIEPMTFHLAAWCLNQQHYSMYLHKKVNIPNGG
jgi:hypothetical protein